jgi:conjugal transfer pilus assembly protein TraA
MKNQALKVLAVFVPTAILASEAVAYSTGTNTGTDALSQMEDLMDEVISWIEGPLGVLLSIAALAVGLGMGIMQQSIGAAIIGIGFAAVISYGPSIIGGVAGSSAEAAL